MVLRCVLFDLGNVLLFFSHEKMCKQIAEVCQRPFEQVQNVLFDEQLQKRFETGKLSEREFHEQLEKRLNVRVNPERLKLAASEIFELNKPMIPLVKGLKKRGIRLVLFSNTCVTHYEYALAKYPLFQQFDDAVLSYKVGASKPDAPMYEAALQAIQCEPHECLYVDDMEPNVEAGKQFGLRAELFRDAQSFAQQLKQLGVTL